MNSDLINLFAETFGIAEDRLVPEATLESLGLDSLAVIEFLFQIEDKFGIQIPDQANPPRTLDEMVQMIEPLMPQGGQGDMGTSAA
ncbi:MAG: acyl carrier protein [Pseudomonadota bacterium]